MIWHRSQFLRLQPGVKLRPHCGEGNFRWVMHLGLDVPKGVAITVGGETVRHSDLRVFKQRGSVAESCVYCIYRRCRGRRAR